MSNGLPEISISECEHSVIHKHGLSVSLAGVSMLTPNDQPPPENLMNTVAETGTFGRWNRRTGGNLQGSLAGQVSG